MEKLLSLNLQELQRRTNNLIYLLGNIQQSNAKKHRKSFKIWNLIWSNTFGDQFWIMPRASNTLMYHSYMLDIQSFLSAQKHMLFKHWHRDKSIQCSWLLIQTELKYILIKWNLEKSPSSTKTFKHQNNCHSLGTLDLIWSQIYSTFKLTPVGSVGTLTTHPN